MMIFPLSTVGKVILILIAIVLGLIWSMLMWPVGWRNFMKKFSKKEPSQPLPPIKKGK